MAEKKRGLFTPALFSRILLALRMGMPYDKAALSAGVHPATLKKWMSESEDIAQQVIEAQAVCELGDLQVIEDAIHGNDQKLAVSTAQWRLERMNPAAWGRTSRNDQYQREQQVKMLAAEMARELGLPAPEVEAELRNELAEMERKSGRE